MYPRLQRTFDLASALRKPLISLQSRSQPLQIFLQVCYRPAVPLVQITDIAPDIDAKQIILQ